MKLEIIKEITSILTKDLLQAKQAAESTKSLARSEEFKAESKWDTRGIEAGYLASAQDRRIKELELELSSLEVLKSNLETREEIGISSLVETEKYYYFITQLTGGITVVVNNKTIKVVSVMAPISKKIMDEQIEYISFS